ncbi:MAG: fibronectin type III domain-containing protein, partial [Ignavibacteriaceae bacterium]
IIDSPFGVISDIDNNGTKEFWTVDQDGDIFSYDVYGDHDYRKGSVVNTGFLGSAAYLSTGDYDGDGTNELAVLLHSIDELDVAPFYRLIVFNLLGEKFNILYDQVLIDAAIEFNSSFQSSENSIRFADLDNDSSDELILFMFPYSYIFNYDSGTNKILSFKENINSNSIFVGDMNLNGVPEVAFPTNQSIKFYEFTGSTIANTPFNVIGYSIDSNSVSLTWNGNVNQYYIFRGKNIKGLDSIATSNTNSYNDSGLKNNTYYYYSIRAYDAAKPNSESDLTPPIKVFVHNPGRILSVKASGENSIAVIFSEKMSNTIENLESFTLNNSEYPNSISPASQYSYLITFKNAIPLGTNLLSVKNLKDLYGSPVPDSTLQFNMDSTIAIKKFFISSFNIESPYSIKIIFNKEVDESSALNTENYFFSPDNKVTSISVDDNDPKVIYLNLKGQKPVGSIGKEYVLRIKNVRSSSSSGNIEINSGAGSYIVLTGFAKDLSDVYVYPNPVKIVDANSKITFANLPNSVKITIWTINGTKCSEVKENDGNGGVDFNLRNFDGELLSSGIYIYRVVIID